MPQAVHAAALLAEREARAAAIADAEEWKSAVTIQNQYSRWRAQQDMREILSAHRSQLNESEEQTRTLRQELQEQQRQSAADSAASAQVIAALPEPPPRGLARKARRKSAMNQV